MKIDKLAAWVSAVCIGIYTPTAVSLEESPTPKCAKWVPGKSYKKSDIYKDNPYKAGEIATYKVSYFGVLVGYGTLKVKDPYHYMGEWGQQFQVVGKTGKWYEDIFKAKDIASSIVSPDFSVKYFEIKQDEHPLIGRHLQQRKTLVFSHEKCSVHERVDRVGKGVKEREFPLHRSSAGVLGAAFRIRSEELKPGKSIRFPVYSSEKNWVLRAEPLKHEKLKIAAGEFEATKIQLHTYIGQELQQRGDVYVWVAHRHPNRPIVLIKGKIKLGSVSMELNKFEPGTPPVLPKTRPEIGPPAPPAAQPQKAKLTAPPPGTTKDPKTPDSSAKP